MAREGARSKDSAKPGIKEVAAVAGVSPTTVSRVLNNRGYISQETRDKVHAAMERVNYAPNDIARAMLNGRLNLIGMIVPYVNSPFHAQAVQAVERTLAENGDVYKRQTVFLWAALPRPASLRRWCCSSLPTSPAS